MSVCIAGKAYYMIYFRGRITALYNTGYFGGAIPAAGITLATQRMASDWAWRIPILIQLLPAVIVMTTVPFLPESPRWLYMHGFENEAFEFLEKYHANGRKGDPLVTLQIEEFKESIKVGGERESWWDYR